MKTLEFNFNNGLIALFLAVILGFTGCARNDEPSQSETLTPQLNLQTLEAETEFCTLNAARADNSYVGSMGEGRAIGIAFLNDITIENQESEQIVVYLYDRENLAILMGEVDPDGMGTFESIDLSDFEATVELEMSDEVVSGIATFPGEQSIPFSADAANGISGFYWAYGTEENPDVAAYWVVSSEESQWGCVCLPPGFNDPCCRMQRM